MLRSSQVAPSSVDAYRAYWPLDGVVLANRMWPDGVSASITATIRPLAGNGCVIHWAWAAPANQAKPTSIQHQHGMTRRAVEVIAKIHSEPLRRTAAAARRQSTHAVPASSVGRST